MTSTELKKEFADLVIRELNRILEIDRKAVTALCDTRVPVVDRLADDPWVTVTGDCELGLLGVLNGMLQEHRVMACYTDACGTIVEFKLFENGKNTQ